MIEPQRLADLFAAHAGPLALYARQLGGDADELVQEAFVRLMLQPREPPHARAWLATTLRHVAIDRNRSWFRRRKRECAVAANEHWFAANASERADADRAVDLLTALPPRQREVVVLRICNGLTLAEIARVVGTSESTAHADYRAALATLRRRMDGVAS